MRRQGNKVGSEADRRTQRVVVLQVLRNDRGNCWSRSELDDELGDLEALAIVRALGSLQEAGVLQVEGDSLSASRAARRLDELELIGV
jgi:hypothetical protein